jgi:hypothetical protein
MALDCDYSSYDSSLLFCISSINFRTIPRFCKMPKWNPQKSKRNVRTGCSSWMIATMANGFHRSPSGFCEAVNGNSNSATNHNKNVAGSSSNNNEINNGNTDIKVVQTPSSNNTSSLASQCDQTLESCIQPCKVTDR